MDANLATLLGVLVTSLTTIIITALNMRQGRETKKAVDAGNATTETVHTIVNGEKTRLVAERDAAHAEIARLTKLIAPPSSP